jgi:hypothetical protein
MKQIAQAFVKAKREFAPALKTSVNPHFRSKYADLAVCLEAVNDALLNNGIALVQRTFEDSTGITVETVFIHESGECLECGRLHVPASKQDPQGYGSALTYARRYSLMAACGIASEDDDGNAASRQKPTADVEVALKGIKEAADIETLKTQFNAAYKMFKDDKEAFAKLNVAKEARKTELMAATND